MNTMVVRVRNKFAIVAIFYFALLVPSTGRADTDWLANMESSGVERPVAAPESLVASRSDQAEQTSTSASAPEIPAFSNEQLLLARDAMRQQLNNEISHQPIPARSEELPPPQVYAPARQLILMAHPVCGNAENNYSCT